MSGEAVHEKSVGMVTPIPPFVGTNKVTAVGAPFDIIKSTSLVLTPVVLLAVIVNVYRPGAAATVLEIVKTLCPTGVTGLTLKLAIAPAGTPETDNEAGSLYPPTEPISTVYTASFG